MKALHREKNNMIIYCQRVLSEAEVTAEDESIKLMQDYESYQKHKLRQVKEERKKDQCDFEKHEDEYIFTVDKLEDELMTVEMKLQDVLGQATMEYQGKVNKVIDEMKGKTSVFIKDVQEQASEFNVEFKEYAMADFERIQALSIDEENKAELEQEFATNEVYLSLVADSDTLKQTLENSKENLDAKIAEKEDVINRAITQDWHNTLTNLLDNQHKRNRNVVENIIEKCQEFRDGIGKA